MEQSKLKQLKDWFGGYVRDYAMDDPMHQRNLDLKVDHTRRVCQAILDVGKSLDLSPAELRLAEAIALLHDVGRFEQYHVYQTYVDSKSEDHAKLGIRVLEKHNILTEIDESESSIIRCSILYHNRLMIPEIQDKPCLFYSRLIRDADKLDVYKVVTDYYQVAHKEYNETIQLDLPDRPEITESVVKDIRDKQVVHKDYLRTLNDFKLLQMGWIYDMHFKRSFEIVRERRYLDLILQSMPDHPDIQELGLQLQNDLEQFCARPPDIPLSYLKAAECTSND